eukprot:9477244-Pyramimonas_sp.AAC.1
MPQKAPEGPKKGSQTSPKRLHNCLQEAPEKLPMRSKRTPQKPRTHNSGTVAGWVKCHQRRIEMTGRNSTR